jgi:hypothetical protein
MNKKKPFAPRHREPTELHFFSSLPLEDAAECIRQLAPDYEVEIQALDEDAYRFEISERSTTALPTVYVKGVMRRWEGTYTTLACETGFRQQTSKLKIQPSVWFWLRSQLLIAGMIIIFLIWLDVMSGSQIFVVEAIPFLLVGFVSTFIVYHLAQRALPDPQFRDFMEHRNDLLDTLKAGFQAGGVIAYSPEELSEKVGEVGFIDLQVNAAQTSGYTSA